MNETLIYLQQICDQLKEMLGLGEGFNVAALIDESEPHKVQGWCIVKLQPDYSMQPIDDKRYRTIKELLHQGVVAVVTGDQIKKAVSAFCPNKNTKVRRKNNRVQFELISMSKRALMDEYKWCIENLPLKEDRGIIYQVSEIYIVTSSQRIIDKVNKHFGSKFGFTLWKHPRVFYID